MIDIQKISFSYKTLDVLKSVSLSVDKGEFFCLLGRNGSGKSTVIKILAQLLQPQEGGVQCQKHWPPKRRTDLSFVFQEPTLDLKLTVLDNLRLSAIAYGVSFKEIEPYLKQFELEEKKNEKVVKLSGGLRRRVDLVRALLSHPKCLILDEPTAGLDEKSFRDFWSILLQLKKTRNLSIFLSTHRAEEAKMCDTIGVIHEGSLIFTGTPEKMRHLVMRDLLVCEFGEQDDSLVEKISSTFSASCYVREGKIFIETEDPASLIPSLVKMFPVFTSVSLKQASLEDAFLKMTGNALVERKL